MRFKRANKTAVAIRDIYFALSHYFVWIQ